MSRPPPSNQPAANVPFHARPNAGPGPSTPNRSGQLPQAPVVRSQEYDRQQYAMHMRQQQMMGQNAVGQAQGRPYARQLPQGTANGNDNVNTTTGPSTPVAGGARPRPVGQGQFATPTGRPLPHPNTPNQMTPTRPAQGARPRPLPSQPMNSAMAQMQNRNPSAFNTPKATPHQLSISSITANARPPGSALTRQNSPNPTSAASSPTSGTFQQPQPVTSAPSPPPFRESATSDPLVAFLAPHLTRKEAEEKARADKIIRFSNGLSGPAGTGTAGGSTTGGPTNNGTTVPSGTGRFNRYQGVYNGGAGLAGPSGRDGMKRERANFVNTAREMMYAFGDVRVPAENTANLMVDMVFGYLSELCTMPPLPPGCVVDATLDAATGKKGAQGAGKNDAEPQIKSKAQEKDKAQDDGEATTPATSRPNNTGPPLRNLTISHLRHRLSTDPAHSLQLSRFQEAFYANKLHKGFDAQRKQTAAAFSANPGTVADVSLQDPAMLEELALHLVDGDKNRLAELYGPEHADGGNDEDGEGRVDGGNVKISLRERKRREMGQFEQSRKRRKALNSQVAKMRKPVENDGQSENGGGATNDDAFGAFAMQLDMEDGEGLGGFLGDELRGANLDVLRRFM